MKQYSIAQVLQNTEIQFRILMGKLEKAEERKNGLYCRFINRCNSLFIVFAQFQVLGPGFEVIYKALSSDLKAFFYNCLPGKTWKGRVLLYCNIGYMMYLIHDFQGSLKFLYDAESFLSEPSNLTYSQHSDLVLAHASVTFLVLFKIKRLEAAEKYIKIISAEFNSILRGDRITKLTTSGCNNLYCLITLVLEVLKGQNSGLITTTSSLLTEKKLKGTNAAALDLLHDFNSNRTLENGVSLINSHDFHSILFAATFFPFILKSTPVLQMHELKKAQEFSRENKVTKSQLAQYIGEPHRSIEQKDMYAVLMMNCLQKEN